MPVTVLSPTVTEHDSFTALLVQAAISGSGGGGTQTRRFRSGSDRQLPLMVLVSAVNEQVSPAILPLQAATGGGGTAVLWGRQASTPPCGSAGQAPANLWPPSVKLQGSLAFLPSQAAMKGGSTLGDMQTSKPA